MSETLVFVVTTYVLQATGALFLALILWYFYRLYARKYLLLWSWSWWGFSIYLAGGAVAQYLVSSFEPSHPLRLGIALCSLAAGYLQVVWLVSGTYELVSQKELRPGTMWICITGSVALAAVSAIAFASGQPGSGPRFFMRVGLRSLVMASGFLVAAVQILRSKGEHAGIGRRIVSGAFIAYGFELLQYFGLSVSQLAGREFFSYAVNLDPVDFLLQSVVGLGMVVWLLEDERERSEKALASLHEGEERLQAILDNSPACIYLKDPQGRYVLTNRRYQSLFPGSSQGIKGKTDFDIFPPKVALTFRANDKKVLSTMKPLESEETMPQEDGLHTYLSLKFPLFDAGGSAYAICGILTDITERTMSEMRLKESLQEKEILLKEIHHRVKNNMQIITSLLNLQSAQVQDPETLRLFKESQSRVKSMALIHEKLYQSEDLARINFAEYIRSLATALIQTYATADSNIGFEFNAGEVYLPIETALPCGLIVNELITNALKHAFPRGQKGTILVELKSKGDGQYSLSVSDNGIGLPEGFDPASPKSLGVQLTTMLVEQIDARIQFQNRQGTSVMITFSSASREKAVYHG